MATTTQNYGLKKPEPSDSYNIEVFNENADAIDEQLKANADAVKTLDPNSDGVVAVAQGGTGAKTAAQARANLGIADVTPIAKGGTGAKTVADALTALGIPTDLVTKLTNFANHISNKSNPHAVKGSQLSDTVPVSKGGTGATKASDAAKNIVIDALGADTATPTDDMQFITSANNANFAAALKKRTAANVWAYMLSKIKTLLGMGDTEIVSVAHGGTGKSSFTSGRVLVGNGSNALSEKSIDSTSGGTANSASLITSGAVNSGLAARAPKDHASSSPTYGKGNSTKYGHVKLTDTYNPETASDASAGMGASQKAVKDAYDAAVNNAGRLVNGLSASVNSNLENNYALKTYVDTKVGNVTNNLSAQMAKVYKTVFTETFASSDFTGNPPYKSKVLATAIATILTCTKIDIYWSTGEIVSISPKKDNYRTVWIRNSNHITTEIKMMFDSSHDKKATLMYSQPFNETTDNLLSSSEGYIEKVIGFKL